MRGSNLFFLICAAASPLALACAAGYRGVPPPGHPRVADQKSGGESIAPSETIWPCSGTTVCKKALRDYGGVFSPEGPWVPSSNYSMRFLNSVANLSASLGKDLCYWSQQTLPAPPNVFGFHHINEFDASRVMNIFGELATSRLQKIRKSVGAIQFVGCSYGNQLRQAQCRFGQNSSFSCSPAVNKQRIKWPVSSVMLKINPDTIQEIADMVFTWRTTETGHWPNMHAGGIKSSGAYQWGYMGGLIAKIVPCEDLPSGIVDQDHACDEVNPASGKLYCDEWWEVWESLCNIYEDPLIPSTLESCNGKEAVVV